MIKKCFETTIIVHSITNNRNENVNIRAILPSILSLSPSSNYSISSSQWRNQELSPIGERKNETRIKSVNEIVARLVSRNSVELTYDRSFAFSQSERKREREQEEEMKKKGRWGWGWGWGRRGRGGGAGCRKRNNKRHRDEREPVL